MTNSDPLRPTPARTQTRDSEMMRQIEDARLKKEAAAAIETAKLLALRQQAMEAAERRAQDQTESELRPRTLKQILAKPFEALLRPTRRK